MVHDLSPFLWRIHGDIGIRWYGLSYLAGFIASYFLIRWLADQQRQGLTRDMVSDFVTYGAIGVLAGGRLGYCVFYSPDLFLKFKASFPFWGVLAVNEGGMSSHGGMIGLVLATTWFAIKHGINRVYLYDLVAICGPLGFLFGRLANFINGELLGRPAPEGYKWAVKFPQEMYTWPRAEVGKLPGLTDVVDKIGIGREQWLEMVERLKTTGESIGVENALYKIIEAIQSGNVAVKEALAPHLTARYPSQLFAAAGEGLFLFVVLFLMWYKPRKPGVIGATFVTLYALVRIVDEQFRLPDEHIGYQFLDLTRGQWLSIGMLFVGLVLLFIYGRRGALKISGWGRGPHLKLGRLK